MPFVTRCPYCRHRARVPGHALGESLNCPGCEAWYTVVPEEDEGSEPERSAATAPTPSPDTRPGAAGDAVAVVAAPVLAEPAAGDPGPDAEPGRGFGRFVSAPGVAACLLAAGALVAASFPRTAVLTRPLSGAGLGLGVLAVLLAAGAGPGRLLFSAAGAVLSGAVLAAALFAPGLFGPWYEASRQAHGYDADALRFVPLKLGPAGSGGLADAEGYADAGRAAVQQGFVRVQVVGAALGPLPPRDPRGKPSRQPHLAVAVRVQHVGNGPPGRFVHWGITEERAVPPVAAAVNGQPLTPARMAWDQLPAGVTYAAPLTPGRAVDDLLVFLSPPAAGPVRLELPAEAWGGRGVVRFVVPESMIATAPAPRVR